MNKLKISIIFVVSMCLFPWNAIIKANVISPGQAFTVSLSCGVNEGTVSVTGSNVSISSSGNWCDRGSSIAVTAVAINKGIAGVSLIAGDECYDTTDPVNPVKVSGKILSSASVTVANTENPTKPPVSNTTNNNTANTNTTKNDTKGTDEQQEDTKNATNTLATLEVDTGELSPVFDTNVTTYDLTLPAGTTKLTINATPKDATATVEGTGEKDITSGETAFDIICKAQDGTATTYTINVHVSEKAITHVSYGKKKLGILNSGATISNLFEEKKIKVNGEEVRAWINSNLKITLLYAQDEKTNQKEYYMYDEKDNVLTSIYRPFAYHGLNLVMIDVPENLQTRKGMVFTKVKLGDYELPGWKFKDSAFKNYVLLYVMNDVGKPIYYLYERTEDSLQLFSQAAAITQDDYQALLESQEEDVFIYWSAIGALGAISFILLITSIVFSRKKNKVKYKKIEIAQTELSAEAKSLLKKEE